MAAVGGDPDFGTYAAGQPFGAAGDFVTAPEIGQVFGELIGLWCAVVWQRMGAPARLRLVELGPGRGTLMADALRATAGVPGFRAALDLHLVETSPTLRRLQAVALASAAPVWQNDVSTVPDGPLIVVANEFVDALPIRQLQRGPRFWHERRIDLGPGGDTFRFVLDAAPSPLAALLGPGFDNAPEGSVAELCPAGLALARTLGERIARSGGAALVIDYGYGTSMPGDTFQAIRGHRRHDPLVDPGSADLTAHVDFARLAQAAAEGGAAIHEPVAQGEFLTRLGGAARTHVLTARATPDQAKRLRSGWQRLIDPAEMGTLFKAVAIADRQLGAPPGFEA
ncbi:MAG: class I SAM-dependent methyltransferase [Alphaproteobacteria bacterium]|nr:class I SAM-dependent methyltransferase [Alphaproteobacteria bacterium]